jgi:RimK family alpha-L-glutamate ligase
MRIALLGGRNGWHLRDLARAAVQLGHEATVLDFRKLSGQVGCTRTALESRPTGSDPLAAFDAIVVRTMPPGSLEQVVFRMDLLHSAQARGQIVLNPPSALETCVDKYLASARLEAAGLPVPATRVCQDADSALEAFEALGGDVVVKPLFGSEGRGLLRISDPETAWRAFRTLERLQAVIYLQQFIQHPGWDLRAFVIGERVVAAMRRRAGKDWRTNVAQGGRAEPVRLALEEERLALRAAAAVSAPVAGVDLLPGPNGDWHVLEVNAVPGWRALAPVAGLDVAALILRFLADKNESEGGSALRSPHGRL